MVKTKVAGQTNALFVHWQQNPLVLLLQSQRTKASKTMTEEPYDGRLSSTVL